jgi:dihydrofolate reductase
VTWPPAIIQAPEEKRNLVDELRLMVFPVVLGSGKRLFGDTSDKKTLRLVDSKIVGDGVAIERPHRTQEVGGSSPPSSTI